LTDTIRNELAPNPLSRIKAMQFLPDEGREQDIIDAMLYLTSPQARFVTGETLRVTGGFTAGIRGNKTKPCLFNICCACDTVVG
jgi:3-oxoacyl-[acyl-carrier protein] reductase